MARSETKSDTFRYTPRKLVTGAIAVNERCMCGALMTQHDHFYGLGHGGCKATSCQKFTWNAFVTLEVRRG